ncbi:MAG: DUF1566 domain-containing protein [Polyangiaceae bacterium]
MRGRHLLRAALAASTVVALATLARADAPSDQYNLFNLNSDMIQDLRTGLYWQRYPLATTVSLADAETACQALSLDQFASGWRVPSYKELLTLVDEAPHYEYPSGAPVLKWIDGNAFPGDLAAPVLAASYWTSSAYPLQPGYAYTVNFNDGTSHSQAVPSTQYVRCVH